MSDRKSPPASAGVPEHLRDLQLVGTPRGVILRIRCRPGRPRTRVGGVHDGALRLDLAAPPEKGKANRELLMWLAKRFGVPQADIEITAGETAREKSVRISSMTVAEIRDALVQARRER